jgi:hypothetical protein
MIEMRWFTRTHPTWPGTQKVLQYRQKVDMTIYAGMGPFPDSARNMQWSEWRDVPEVVERDMNCP